MPSRTPRTVRSSSAGNGVSWFPLALFVLFAVGCVATGKKKKKGPRSLSFQVDPESDLWEPARLAASEWSYELGRPITVTPDGNIPIFRIPEESCDPEKLPDDGSYFLACAKDIGSPDARIEISSATQKEDLIRTLLHEMGHHLSGTDQHNPDADSLLANGSKRKSITRSDVAWVCRNFECNPPPPSSPRPPRI